MQNSLPVFLVLFKGVPGGSDGKESACNVGGLCSIPRWGRSPGERNSNSLQYSCLGNSMGRGAWQATVHGVTKNQTQQSDLGSQRIKHNRVTIAHPHSLLQESFHPGLSLGSLLCFGHTGYASSSHDIIVKSSFASSGSLLLQISA